MKNKNAELTMITAGIFMMITIMLYSALLDRLELKVTRLIHRINVLEEKTKYLDTDYDAREQNVVKK
jgi:hypothetical protein